MNEEQLEMLKDMRTDAIETIRALDNKINFLFAIISAIVGLLLSNIDKIKSMVDTVQECKIIPLLFLAILSIVLIFSLVCIIQALKPISNPEKIFQQDTFKSHIVYFFNIKFGNKIDKNIDFEQSFKSFNQYTKRGDKISKEYYRDFLRLSYIRDVKISYTNKAVIYLQISLLLIALIMEILLS